MGKKNGFLDRCLSKNDFATTEAFAINSMTVSTRTGKLTNFAVGLQILLKFTEIILDLGLLNMSKTDNVFAVYLQLLFALYLFNGQKMVYKIIYCIAGFGVLEQRAAKNKLHSSQALYSS